MNGSGWWNRNRKQYALPAAGLTGALVWMAGNHFQNSRKPNLQSFATASLSPAGIRQRISESPQEPREDRTPHEIAETLRTDPRGTQQEDRSRVWRFLRDAEGWKAEMETAWLLGADEALSWLRGAEHAAPEIETGLCSLVRAHNIPVSLREYALQHLSLWAEEHAAGIQVLETFKQTFLSEETSSLAGIALTGLCRSCFGTQEAAWIRTHALSLAAAGKTQPKARAAALEILAQYGVQDAEPVARSFFTKEATIDEKISALQVLGRVGTAETLGWLASFSKDPEPLTAAAQHQAVQALRARWILAD